MKGVLKDKFKNNILVKPLYRKLKNGNKIKPKILIFDRLNLDGNGISVKRNVINDNRDIFWRKKYKNKGNKLFLSASRENKNNKTYFDDVNRIHARNRLTKDANMLSAKENIKPNICEVEGITDKTDKFVQADNQIFVAQAMASTWLRLYPLPKHPGESTRSVIFRCILCQLGLCTLLLLWTMVIVFLIHSFEGPYEIKQTLEFENAQKLLVIDLATELRQITPLSPKWRRAIERRIQDERDLTVRAVSRGARFHPGQFWDLSGTFLFTIYVMTALGFGAPVPQTLWGRTSALIHAIIAVPTHGYLMLNASMCIVVHVESYMMQMRCNLREKRPFGLGTTALQNVTDSPNCSRSSDVLKASNRSGVGKKIMRFLNVMGACRSVPLVAILYYACGAAAFGFARRHTIIDIAIFPLEFTTSGGLDRVEGHIRILYGFYVEGAVLLLYCGLAMLRRHSGAAITCMTKKYRLFEREQLLN